MIRAINRRHHAFTLIEAVICVVVLGLAVPPTLELLGSAAADRADAVNTERATSFAQSILESALADVASRHSGLGFESLTDAAAFETGFRARNSALIAAYAEIGMSFQLDIGPLVDRTGASGIDQDDNIFRVITVTVSYPSASGDDHSMPVAIMVGAL